MVDSNLNIWTSVTVNTNKSPLGVRKEASMRDELISLLDGSSREIPKAQIGLYRRTKLDSNGRRIRCSCVDDTTREPDKDPRCPYCLGVGWLWTEVWFEYYKVVTGIEASLTLRDEPEQPGRVNIPRVTFYTKYDIKPVIINGRTSDRIVEVSRDLEGNVITSPYERTRVYRIGSAIDLRCDNGRLEFWKFTCHPDDIPGTGIEGDI